MPRYRIAGLDVGCDLPLVGRRAGVDDDRAEIDIRRGAVPAQLAMPQAQGPNWQAGAREVLIEIPGLARFLIEDGHAVRYQPMGDDAGDLAPFLTGLCIAVLLRQRGVLCLDAAAVAIHGRALILCGPPGAGVSTLAAALCAQGAAFVAEDVVAIRLADDTPPRVSTEGEGWCLSPDSIRHLGLEAGPKHRLRAGLEKYLVPAVAAETAESVAIGAICVLRDWRPSRQPGITRLAPAAAAQALLEYAFCARLVLALGQQSRQLADTVAILRHVSVFGLAQEGSFGRLNDTAVALRQAFRAAAG